MKSTDDSATKVASRHPHASASRSRLTSDDLANLLFSLPDAVLVHEEGRIVFANPHCVRLLRATHINQLVDRHIEEIIPTQEADLVRERIAEIYRSGAALPPKEHVVTALDGTKVDVDVVAAPITWQGAPAMEVVFRDISERKKAQAAAKEWEQRLALAQKAGLEIGLWEWDFEADTVLWSPEIYRLFGYSQDSFRGTGAEFRARIYPEDYTRVEEAIKRVREGHQEFEMDYRILRPDGAVMWVASRGVVVRNGRTRMIGIAVDLTDIKKTEESLRQTEEQYLLLLNSTAEGIYGLDLEGNCTFCNPSCVRLLGYSNVKELLGKNMHSLMHHTRADGGPYRFQECKIYSAFKEGRCSHVADEVLWRADGASFPAEYWSYPMHKDGRLVGTVVTFIDITERKRAEEAIRTSERHYRDLFEQATYGIFRATPEGRLLDVNSAMLAILGYNSREDLLLRNLNTDIYDNPAERMSAIQRCEASGRVDGVEVAWKRKDGKKITVRMSGRTVFDESGQATLYEVIVEDITERRILEQQLRQAQKMEAVGRLAAGVAHDFNNALAVINGYSELIQLKIPASDPAHGQAQEIFKAGERAAGLTRQLLAFSRQQPMCPVILDLNAVVADTDKMLRRLIGEDINLVLARDSKLGRVRADQGQIEQILMNLAVNARDAMPTGGKLTIETANAELTERDVRQYPFVRAGSYVMLGMSDTGCGMDEETQSHVFEPFYTTKPIGQGTGLGLSTVYGIVKQSGGYILLDSQPNKGARFRIYFPRVAEISEPSRPKKQKTLPGGDETILVVEDESALRALVRTFLEARGYTVLAAHSSDSAIKLAQQHSGPIQMLLTDVILPGTSGRILADELKRSRAEIKVLYMSGYTDDLISKNGILDRETALLHKPFTMESLLNKVRSVLDDDTSQPSRSSDAPT